MKFDNSLLYHFVRDALGPYSEDFRLVEKRNPITIRLNGHVYSIHVSYAHDSGNTRPNDDEIRIQVGRSSIEEQRNRMKRVKGVAFLGFFPGGKVFIGWDPRHVFSLQARKVVSIYARQSQLAAVESSNVAVHKFNAKLLGESSFAIALPSSALGFYLENLDRFHQLSSEESMQHLMHEHTDTFNETGLGKIGEFDVVDGGIRKKFVYKRKAFPRDRKFKEIVLSAYDHACCICDKQLGLVEAAHIIPHSEPDCLDTVQNGLAMCVEHHRLYDGILLLPGPNQQLVFNKERAKYLQQTGQGVGLDDIEELSKQEYYVPEDPTKRPLNEYLQRGIKIRCLG